MSELVAAPDWLALRRKVSVKQAAELNDISEDTFRRRYAHLIRKISPRRDAVELGDALAIGNRKTEWGIPPGASPLGAAVVIEGGKPEPPAAMLLEVRPRGSSKTGVLRIARNYSRYPERSSRPA